MIEAEEKERKRLYNRAYYAANRDRYTALNRRWAVANLEKRRAYKQARSEGYAVRRRELWRQKYETRKKELRARSRANYEKFKEKWKARVRAYQRRNRAQGAMHNAGRRAAAKQATPRWANRFFMAEIYHLAVLRSSVLGIPHQVDHIVPLRSKLVSGLHWEGNLRVIPAIENNKKYNSTWPDKP